MADEAPRPESAQSLSSPKAERKPYRDSWKEWLREEFLRSCFVGASLAWDGFGAIQVRYLLDPYYPGQGAAPAWVYAAMVLFVLGSLVGEVFLYRRWWPTSERQRKSFRPPENLDEFYARVQRKRYF